MQRIDAIKSLVGNTPLLVIEYEYKSKKRLIYAKAEHLNMTGSIKDRMALHIMGKAYASGALRPGAKIIEATSGNTGISFSAIGAALGHPVTIFMPDWMSEERKNLIRALGASVELVSKDQGGFVGSIQLAEDLATSEGNAFLPRQFSNDANVEAHFQTTGPEIFWQLSRHFITPQAFVAGVGTGGTVMGVGAFLKQVCPGLKVHPLEPANSPTLTTGHKVGKHRIQGISDEFIPPIVVLSELDHVVSVDDGDAIIMAQKLAQRLGLGVGISSGANFLGAVQLQNELGDDTVLVTIFPDDNKKYLSTDLIRQETVQNGFLSTEVKLTGFKAISRVCNTGCDLGLRNDGR
ncbi:MAG: cysteine synthase [Bdellovibrionales bacterium GWA2_49_15]|nr:MAG: cysteine synthase [Bdellovibrionales bacterium GWA2_49_15]HAZ13137.1 cysteine synthase [Bdellovibrionales bacterium]